VTLDCKCGKSSKIFSVPKPRKAVTTLLQRAFTEIQKLPNYLQDELAQQLLEDIESELKWQKSLSREDIELGSLLEMAQEALLEDQEGRTEDKGFGEE
jgi:DNA phosphorothioation-dependent restriction protein DptG